ncbi:MULTISPECIES: hypothetical protein [unclassified Roseateles]|uniref:hypothetical protein n=1 Tax=unclassified Roseateles TaxID=2626991 RepID=UPI0006F59ED4|nr:MULTISPECIES: hypothetical protein [unclassified Roseateles]
MDARRQFQARRIALAAARQHQVDGRLRLRQFWPGLIKGGGRPAGPGRGAGRLRGQGVRRRRDVRDRPAAQLPDVGRKNGEAARELLQQHGIPIVSESLFGDGHRQIIFSIRTGEVWMRHVTQAPTSVWGDT